MIVCPFCNNQLEDDAKFCTFCGNKIVTKVFCEFCGTETTSEFSFCQKCGAPLATNTTAPAPVMPQNEITPEPEIIAETVIAPEPEPVIIPEPEIVIEPEPAPVIIPEPAPVYAPVPAPEVAPEPTPVYTPVPEVAPQPTPVYAPAPAPTPVATAVPVPPPYVPEPKKPRSKFPKKLVIIGSACLSVILIAAIVFATLFTEEDKPNFALYVKDNEMYYTDVEKLEPWQITNHLIDDDDYDEEDLIDSVYSLGYFTHITNDGKMIFYVDRITSDSYGASLYYRYLDRPEDEPCKIDSDITSYAVSEDGKLVTYIKGEERTLYQHDLTDKEKIDRGVYAFEVSDDGTKLGWLNEEGGLYLKYADQDKEKLDSNVSSISFVNEAFDTVYYLKEDTLYKMVEGQEREKIDSEVHSVIDVYESGEAYYLKSDTTEYVLFDYVEDDMASADRNMVKPEYPDYPYSWYYDDYDEYWDDVDEYYEQVEEYEIAIDKWYDKLDRDELREELKETSMEYTSYTLYYYDGSDQEVLTENLASNEFGSNYYVADDSAVIVYSVNNQSTMEKVKISDIDDLEDVEDMVKNALYYSSDRYVAAKGNDELIEHEDAQNFDVASDGHAVYFMDNVSDETAEGDLYKINISGDIPEEPILYADDVSAYSGYFLSNDKYVYYKEVNDSNGDLYVDNQLIDYDVTLYYLTYLEDTDTLVYLTDWNSEKSYGTLKIYKDDKASKIADDVHDYETTPCGEILYLQDYSTTYCNGELFIYKDEEPVKIDDDVTAIVPIYDFKYHGNVYRYW